MSQHNQKPSLLSIVTPAYNETANLPLLYAELSRTLDALSIRWEWLVVDDHSADQTFATITELRKKNSRVRGFRFSRNFGSHKAILCGLENMKGDCAVIMAADLQDPPELIAELLAKWREGTPVVWAVRNRREGVGFISLLCSRFYYFLMRYFIGLKEMPAEGADFLLIDRKISAALGRFNESHFSIFALITWMGFPQASVTYDKKSRLHGTSGWNFEKKLNLALDSILSFSYRPIRMISIMGLLLTLAGLLWAAAGKSPIIAVLLCLSGIQWVMAGLLGEYLYRALDETRRRPRYVIEAATDDL